MKDPISSTITNVHDFLQDVQGFLEQTLASERLSRLALEQRTRLITKLSALIKEYENHHQMQLYIDMSPTLKSFFQSSDGSTSDNSSVRDPVPINEEFYDIPNGNLSFDIDQPLVPEDVCDAPAFPPVPLAIETKKLGFMQRLLKPLNKASDSSLTAAKNQNRSEAKNAKEGEDDQNRRESGNYCYDDVASMKASVPPRADMAKEEAFTYDDASGFHTFNVPALAQKPKISDSKSSSELDIYNDASQVIVNDQPCEDYEYVNANGTSTPELHNNNNDSDKISMKSGVSSYGATSSHRWHIAAAEAKSQALRYGCMKRRNGRKLLSAWRNCYSVLLPAHLLMYASEKDYQPRVVIDLSEPNITVKRMVKQGVDSKRLKTHPFVLLHEDRSLYEMSTKSREETEEWISSIQAILVQVSDSQDIKADKTDDDDDDIDSVYDEPSGNTPQRELQNRMDSIQGRNLPSLPPAMEKQDTIPLQSQEKSSSKANYGNILTLSRIQRGRSSSSSEEEKLLKRQSVDNSTNTDEVYQELPSPTASGTPYSSIESLQRSSEELYYNFEDTCKKPNSGQKENINSDSIVSARSNQVPDRSVHWPSPPTEEDLSVYDIPSPTIRPLSSISVMSNEGEKTSKPTFASQIVQKRNFVLNQQARKISCSGPVTVVVNDPEVYDVPASNPRPISMTKEIEPEALKAYNRVPTPPRTVIPPPETNPPSPPSTRNKLARTWKEKLDNPLNSFKKESSPTKCLPKPSAEVKSVGRCFSKTTSPRAPLTSLTELLASSKNGGNLKPSALKSNAANQSVQTGSSVGNKIVIKPNITLKPQITEVAKNDNNSTTCKKEPPPRPPAPIRLPLSKKTSEPVNVADELNRKLMQRAMKNRELDETSEAVAKETSANSMELKEQYKARWAFVATNHLELSINSGEIVQVLSKRSENWLIQCRNKKGLVPKDYLVPLTTNALSLTKIGEPPITV